jgi:hypothetical protein
MGRYGADEVSNRCDILDSRNVIARIEELEGERETLEDAVKEAKEAYELAVARHGTDASKQTEESEDAVTDAQDAVTDAEKELASWDEDYGAELKSLKALQDEGEGCSDWSHGTALIRDSYFEDYARELADDIGAIDSNAGWPLGCIDWEQAADELKSDYTSIDFDGVTYWVRS